MYSRFSGRADFLFRVYRTAARSVSNSYISIIIIRPGAARRPIPHSALVGRTMMTKRTMITGAQIRAARALLNWPARELSQRSGVSQSSIHRAEHAEDYPSMHEHSLAAIKTAFEQYGVEFLDGCGLRLGTPKAAGRHPGVEPAMGAGVGEPLPEWEPTNGSLHDRRSPG
jgi:transcriptional regulator with XRE-family HTH domain